MKLYCMNNLQEDQYEVELNMFNKLNLRKSESGNFNVYLTSHKVENDLIAEVDVEKENRIKIKKKGTIIHPTILFKLEMFLCSI